MNKLINTLLRGLGVLLPIFCTFYLLYWLVVSIEHMFKAIVTVFVSEKLYFNGLGVLFGLILTLLVGYTMRQTLVARIFDFFEQKILKLPFIKTIYGSIKDFITFFSDKEKNQFSKPGLLRINDSDESVLGFVTSHDPHTALGAAAQDKIAVYLPMSCQIGGYTVFVSPDKFTELDITVEEAFSYALTAGISAKKTAIK